MKKITSEVLNNWKSEIGALNVEKGWRTEPRTIEDHCALLHSEVSEAFEDYRNNHAINEVWYEHKIYISSNGYDEIDISDEKILDGKLGKPCGIPSELADVVIRALDMADEFGLEIKLDNFKISKNDGFVKEISSLHLVCSNMLLIDTKDSIDVLISFMINIAKKYGVDLYQEIEDKIAYNRTRPARHGGKKI